MREEKELPRGWIEAPVSEIAELVRGVSYDKSAVSGQSKDGYLAILRATNIQNEHLILDSDLVYVPREYVKPVQLLELYDVVICTSSGSKDLVGKTAQLTFNWQGSFGAFCAVARFDPLLNRQFAGYFFGSPRYRELIRDKSSGVNINNLRHSDIEKVLFPIPPLPEQQDIVAVIEQLFSRLDAGVAALRRAQAKLKRYRAAVLKAAVEGKLTDAWRAEHPTTEPASKLLERILVECRAKWEADLRAKGKDPAKAKYVEPAKPDVEDFPELPEGWCWATVEQLAATEPNSITDGPFGSNLKTEHYKSEGGRVIRLQNIGEGEFKDEKAFIALEHLETLRKHRVFAGDLVIAALGENPPRSCIIPDFVGPAIVKADCIRFKVSPNILNTFVNVALNAEPTRKRTASQLHGIGRPRLNLTEIRSIVIPLPPLTEQEQIVAEVERRLSVVSQLEATVETNLKRAERLRQSILKEAFAGRLVPQDPDDESASVLLERIHADREKWKHGALDKGREVICEIPRPKKIDVKGTKQVELWESLSSGE